MSEFNLEEFMNGTPAYTRDGRKAEFIAICDKCIVTAQFIALIDGNDIFTIYFKNGNRERFVKSDLDLVRMA